MDGKLMSRIRILTAVLILIPVCFSQSRQSRQPPAPVRPRPLYQQQAVLFEETPAVTKVMLKNGLTILVEEFKSKPVVSIQTYIRAGFLNESPKGRGAARLLPSLVCRRPVNKNTGTLEENVYALGGLLRASVDHESTRFEIVAPSPQWKKALSLQSEALTGPSFDPAELLPEVKLLVKEARTFLDRPYELSGEKVLELAFEPIRMGKNSEIGEGGWQGLKPEEVSGFFNAYYVPSRMTVVLSGDISASEVLNEVTRTYGKFSTRSKPEPAALTKTSKAGFRYQLLRGNVRAPQTVFAFRATTENASDYRALEVLSAMLGLGEGSILKYRLRDQEHMIWSGESSLWGHQNFGCLLIRMEMDEKDIDRSQIGILTEIELLKRQEPVEAELARAVAQLEVEYWKRLDTVTGRAETLAYFDSIGDWKGRDRHISDLKKVSPADIRRVATKYLRLENCALLEYLPLSGEDARNPTVEGMRQTLGGLLEPSADQQQAKRDKETAPYLKIPQGAGGFTFSEIQYPFQLASILRGPEMYIREDHTSPLVTMGIYFPGGKFDEDKGNAGITRLMTDMIVRGTPDMRAGRFYHQLEVYGGQIEPVVSDDYFGFNFSILSANFEAGFNLLKQAVKSPVFEKEEVERQKELQTLAMQHRKASEANARDLLHQTLFGEFSYSENGLGTPESLAAITPASLLQWHGAYVKNRKPLAVIIGDTKGTSLAGYFVKEFSGSRMQDTKIAETWVKPLNKGAAIEQSWKGRQSLILIGFQAPPVDDEDGYAVTVLENLAGNLGRLSQHLRHKLGAANDVSVTYQPRLRGGSLIAYATTDPEDEDAVFSAMREELLRIAAGPITYKECRSAVNAAIGMHGIRNQDRSNQIHGITEYLLTGKGIAGYQSFPAVLQDINEEDLAEAAQRVFNMEKAAVVRVHGRPN